MCEMAYDHHHHHHHLKTFLMHGLVSDVENATDDVIVSGTEILWRPCIRAVQRYSWRGARGHAIYPGVPRGIGAAVAGSSTGVHAAGYPVSLCNYNNQTHR